MGSSTSSPTSHQHQGNGNSRPNNRSNNNGTPVGAYRIDGRNSGRGRRGSSSRASAYNNGIDSNPSSPSNAGLSNSGANDLRQQQQNQKRSPTGLEGAQDVQNSTGRSHLLLNTPYPMLQRVESKGLLLA